MSILRPAGQPGPDSCNANRPHPILQVPEFLHPTFCKRATTRLGFHKTASVMRIVPVRCKCWNCDYCKEKNLRILQAKIAEGNPNRLITLTTKLYDGETPEACHERTRCQVSRLIYKLRQKYGEIEYACVLEKTKLGRPHWHLLVRSGYIPQRAISAIWMELTGAFIVDVRQLQSKGEAVKYVTKYVLKAVSGDASSRLGRIISFSHGYLKEQKRRAPNKAWRWTCSPFNLAQTLAQAPPDCRVVVAKKQVLLVYPPGFLHADGVNDIFDELEDSRLQNLRSEWDEMEEAGRRRPWTVEQGPFLKQHNLPFSSACAEVENKVT